MSAGVTLLLLQLEYMRMGIVPLSGHGSVDAWADINKVLAELSHDDAQKMRRKFRKEWRRIFKRASKHGGQKGRRLHKELCRRGPNPSRENKNARKRVVLVAVGKKVLAAAQAANLSDVDRVVG